MSVKDFEPVFSTLNTEFVDLKSKVETLINKYEDLEKQLKKQKKFKFKCNQCKKKFENIKELQDHRKEEGSCESNFKCDECGKTFRNKKQLEVHEKKHQKFECDECDCEFSYEGLLERHTEAVHGDINSFAIISITTKTVLLMRSVFLLMKTLVPASLERDVKE